MLLSVIAVVFALIATLGLVVWTLINYCPHYLIQLVLCLRRYRCGMTIKYVRDQEMTFCYGERGRPQAGTPSLLFLHGFTCSKDQWIPCFNALPKDLHMIALDIVGHGGTKITPENVPISNELAAKFAEKFVELTGMADRQFHIIGASFGGVVAAIFCTRLPANFIKLTLISPAMNSPIESIFYTQFKEARDNGGLSSENCLLLFKDVTGIKAMMELCCYDTPNFKLEDQFYKGLVKLREPRLEFYTKLINAVSIDYYLELIVRNAQVLTMPIQVIWGREDKVINVSGADFLKSKLPNCRYVDVIERCGHLVDVDRPGALNKHLLKFILDDGRARDTDKKYN